MFPFYRRTSPGPTVRKLFLLDPMLVRLLRRLHQEIGFDVVHAHHYEGLLVASHALRGIPIVYDAHTLLASELPTYRLALPRRLIRAVAPWLDRYLPRRADHTIAVSETIRHTLTSRGASAPERVHVIPNGVEWERFPAERAITPNGPTVIFAGNLAPYQGVDLMLEAFAQLHGRLPMARLMIVTDSPFTPYEALARRLGVRGRGGTAPGHVSRTAGHPGGGDGRREPSGPMRRHPAEAAQLHGRRHAGRDLRELGGPAAA